MVWRLWSVVVVSPPAAGFQLSTGEIFWLISCRASWARRCASPTRSWFRASAVATGRSSRPPCCSSRASVWPLRVEPRDPVRRAPAHRRPRRLRRRQLRQLDVEHHVLLPCRAEGVRARTQRRRWQPRRLGRAVRHHHRRRGHPQPPPRGPYLGAAHPGDDGRRVRPHGQPQRRQSRRGGIPRRPERAAPMDPRDLYIGTFDSLIGLHGPSRTRKITPGSRDVCP